MRRSHLEDRPVAEIWDSFKASGDRALRDHLIMRYEPLVKYAASRVLVGLPRSVEEDDLVSYGMFGLIDAIEKFDTDRQIKFETYALSRVKGAIIDGLRSLDWVPRSVRVKARSVEQAYAKLEGSLLRTPTEAEVAAEMDVSGAEFQQILMQTSLGAFAHLDEVIGGEPESSSDTNTLADMIEDKTPGPGMTSEVVEMQQVLAGAIERLGDREKTFLSLFYFTGLTLSTIGEVFGVTESRVSQIQTRTLHQLQRDMLSRV